MKEKLLQLLARCKALWLGATQVQQIGVCAGVLAVAIAAGVGIAQLGGGAESSGVMASSESSSSESSITEPIASEPETAAPAEWKQIYYNYIKEEFINDPGILSGKSAVYFQYKFYDINNDGVPEMSDHAAYPLDAFSRTRPLPALYRIAGGEMRAICVDDSPYVEGVIKGGSPVIFVSSIYRDRGTGEIILSGTYALTPPKALNLFSRENGEWKAWQEAGIEYKPTTGALPDESSIDEYNCLFYVDQQKQAFLTVEEVDAAADAYLQSLQEKYERIEGTPLDLSEIISWEAASPIVVTVLNSLDGKNDFTGDAKNSSAPAYPEWKQLYYYFIKDAFENGPSTSNGEANTFFKPKFFEVDGDGVPELWVQTTMPGNHNFAFPLYTVRARKILDIIPIGEMGNTQGISDVYLDKETGETVLADHGGYLFASHSTLYHKQNGQWERYWEESRSNDSNGTYNLAECYIYENGQSRHFSTQEEANEYFETASEKFNERYESVQGTPLDLSEATSWEEASPIVVAVLNSLDGKDNFTGDGAGSQAPAASSGTQVLTTEQRGTIYELYVRHIVKIIHDHGSPNGHQMASMAVGMDRARPYLHDLEPEVLKSVKEKLPGVRFQQSISLDDLNLLQREVYGSDAPKLTAADLSAGRYGTIAVKDPTAVTFGGLASYMVYDDATKLVLIGESELAQSAKPLNLVENEREEKDEQNVVHIYLDIITYIICRGEYENGGFYPTPDGSVYAVLDKFGETVITQTEYEQLFSTTDYDALLNLIRQLRDKYGLRGVESTLPLNGDPANAAAMTVGQAKLDDGQREDEAQSTSAVDENTAIADAAETYKSYYLSFLQAINALDGSLTSYCTENQRARQEERIFRFNKDYTFENRHIYIDRDSIEFGYENGLPTVKFNARCENDMREREKQNAPTEENVAHAEVTLQQENGAWRVVYSHVDNRMEFGSDAVDITRQPLQK